MVFQSFFMLDVSLAVSTNSMIADLAAPPFQDESASVSAATTGATGQKKARSRIGLFFSQRLDIAVSVINSDKLFDMVISSESG